MIAQGVNRSAIICMFFSLSIYLWLLSDFFLEILFFLVKKVGLVCGRGLSVLYYENLCPNALFSLSGFIFICLIFICIIFIFIDMFVNCCFFHWGGNTPSHIFHVVLYGQFQSIVYIVFKISILIFVVRWCRKGRVWTRIYH